jgi:hypothetical protein
MWPTLSLVIEAKCRVVSLMRSPYFLRWAFVGRCCQFLQFLFTQNFVDVLQAVPGMWWVHLSLLSISRLSSPLSEVCHFYLVIVFGSKKKFVHLCYGSHFVSA